MICLGHRTECHWGHVSARNLMREPQFAPAADRHEAELAPRDEVRDDSLRYVAVEFDDCPIIAAMVIGTRRD